MIPLTSSLYIEAELDSSESVLVELGTGYYAEVCAAGLPDQRTSQSNTHLVLS